MQFDTLDEQSALEHIQQEYPCLLIEEPGDPIALVVPSLEVGELPLLCRVNGVLYKVATISKSALVINALLRITRLTFYRSATDSSPLSNAEDILKLGVI